MLLGAPRRTLAAAAVTATLGAAFVAPAVRGAQQPAAAEQQALLPAGLVDDLFAEVDTLGLQPALILLGIDEPAEFAEILATASPAQLDTLVGGLTAPQLTGGLDALLPAQLGGVLADLNLTDLQVVLGTVSAADLSGALQTLSAGDLARLLSAANPAQLPALVGGVLPADLTAALALFDPADLMALLTGADADTLTALVGGMDPGAITGVLGQDGGPDVVLGGLTGVAGGLAGADASAVDGLLAQVTALLAGGTLPTDLAGLDGLLATVNGLLTTAGLDPAILRGLYDQLAGVLAQIPVVGPGATTVLGTLGGLLGIVPGGGGTDNPPGAGPTNPPGGGTTTPPGGGTTTPGARNLAYRALVKSVKVAKNRRSVKVKVTCPVGTAGCIVALTGKAAKRSTGKAKWFGLGAGGSKTVKVKLSRRIARSLKRKGGRISFTATTLYSTLGPKTKTVKVKQARRARP